MSVSPPTEDPDKPPAEEGEKKYQEEGLALERGGWKGFLPSVSASPNPSYGGALEFFSPYPYLETPGGIYPGIWTPGAGLDPPTPCPPSPSCPFMLSPMYPSPVIVHHSPHLATTAPPRFPPHLLSSTTRAKCPLPSRWIGEKVSYVNPKQYERILKIRERKRQKGLLDERHKMKYFKSWGFGGQRRRKYIHKSRHVLALTRSREKDGRFKLKDVTRRAEESKKHIQHIQPQPDISSELEEEEYIHFELQANQSLMKMSSVYTELNV